MGFSLSLIHAGAMGLLGNGYSKTVLMNLINDEHSSYHGKTIWPQLPFESIWGFFLIKGCSIWCSILGKMSSPISLRKPGYWETLQYDIFPPISAHLLMLPFCSWFFCLKLPRENLVVKVLMAFLVQEEREWVFKHPTIDPSALHSQLLEQE